MSSLKRQAFTLVELILAIALTTVILVVVHTAVEVQLRAFQNATRRTDRDRLVYALLRRIAADLHGAMGAAVASQGATSSADAAGAALDDAVAMLADELNSTLIANTGETLGPVGLRGESDRLWIDVIRVRPPDLNASDAMAWFADAPVPEESGIRTILYYVVAAEESTVTEAPGREGVPASTRAGGLVRRELVEPIALYARQLGLLDELDTSVQPLAAEVVGVAFRYHDGDDWCESWDSNAAGELPRAVEIMLYMASDDVLAFQASTPNAIPPSTDDAFADAMEYRLVVSLPIESPSDDSATDGDGTRQSGEGSSSSDDMDANLGVGDEP